MRGQKLFNAVLRTEDSAARKGRSETMLLKRNSCLAARYYFYGCLRKKTYEDILNLMMTEFFISPDRIARIIQQNISLVKEMKDRKLTKSQLRDNWPYFKW
ncbi:MAG: hypothetical protein H7257_09260 [Taibaiella sp.]|nr:hypothetical protein [Taibaiella sp.]